MRNPVQEYETARSLPLQALVAVMQGKSDVVSLGVAHAAIKEKTEAEIAKKGAQAAQMAQAPKVKDRDIAMAQGLASTSADLNVPMGGIVGGEGTFGTSAAGGGSVVAFQPGGSVKNSRLIGVLENVLAQLQDKDPSLNVDYVRRAVLSAPESQQQQLMQQLVERVGMEDQFKPAVTSFTEALEAKEVDPKVMRAMQLSGGLSPDEMATPSPLTKEASGLASIARDPTQSDTGAQYGAPPLTGSQILAQKADAAGNIYRDALFKQNAEGASSTFSPYEDAIATLGGGQNFIKGNAPERALRAQMESEGRAAADMPKKVKKEADDVTSSGIARLPQKDQEATAATSPLDYLKIMAQAGNMAERDSGRDDIKTAKQQMQAYDDLLKDAGFDFNIVRNQMAELAKEKEEVKGSKKEAVSLRLLEAGLGILGGESPYAFVNIGKGATPALQGLAKDIKDIQKESRLLDKESRQLSMMQNQMAEGRARFSQAQVNRQEDKVERAEDRIAADKRSMFQTITSSETQKQVAAMQQETQRIAAGALKMERELARTDARAKSALDQATDFVEKTMKLSPPEEQAAEVKRLFRQFYGTMYGENKELGSGRAQGKVVNGVYVPAGQ